MKLATPNSSLSTREQMIFKCQWWAAKRRLRCGLFTFTVTFH